MIIFLAKIYEKSVAILDANCPLTRITLRAEKALRVMLPICFDNPSGPDGIIAHFSLAIHLDRIEVFPNLCWQPSGPDGITAALLWQVIWTEWTCCPLSFENPSRPDGIIAHFALAIHPDRMESLAFIAHFNLAMHLDRM